MNTTTISDKINYWEIENLKTWKNREVNMINKLLSDLKELKEQQAEQIRLYEKTLDITTDQLMAAQAERNELKEAAQPVSFDSFTDELHLRLEYHISIGNTPRMALTLALADCQYLYPAAQPVDSSHSQTQSAIDWLGKNGNGIFTEKFNGEISTTAYEIAQAMEEYKNQFAPVSSHPDNRENIIEGLRNSFEKETGSRHHKYHRYSLWLENKISDYRQSSPVEAAQPQQPKETAVDIINSYDFTGPDGGIDYNNIREAMEKYADQFKSKEQPSGKVSQAEELQPIDYYRAGYKHFRGFNEKIVEYDGAAEMTMEEGFKKFLAPLCNR